MKHLTSLFLGLILFSCAAQAIVELDFGKTRFIAAVVINVENERNIEVWINPRAHWIQNQNLTDHYSNDEAREVERITDKTNLCNLAESQYEPCRSGRSVQQIMAALMHAGVEIDPSFQAWAEKEISR